MPPSIAREPDQVHHIPALDGWRGLAVIMVLMGHFGADRYLPNFSSFGVDLFFVLSGRLMADILFIKHMPLPMFFAKRFARVYPALFMFVLITGLAFHGRVGEYDLNVAALALTFTLNYAMAYGHPFSLLDHIWSLCVEEHSYILLGLIAFATRLWSKPIAWGLILAAGLMALINGVVRIHLSQGDWGLIMWRTDVAMAGIFISAALFIFLRPSLHRDHWTWIAPCALVSAILARMFGVDAIVFFGVKTILLATAVIGIEYSAPWFRRNFEGDVLRFIGQCSFSIYLWQEPFFKLTGLGVVPPVFLLVLGIACGVASYYLIERPLRATLNAMFSRRPVEQTLA
ncbi:acyltransferase family protein [Rhizobium leucaenae]|uniref:Peptidoglycan/LPS O-acetylase OafA/YrhL n=1 Tax=Rhizobium leucaenae TaxID=29450 RepID=A0A7W6ZRP1_9HYPH|nr:acyltransferase [Rhizobium leucaenae]MBB4567379.1 peptidoglycan/LPS O-acetylase OafA/YrhL [Rhizobium leucaenae]MBB6303127.1 peptidoglycan/LPS O-acetylase OafA/YrhL [Rhizobium leucaenae]